MELFLETMSALEEGSEIWERGFDLKISQPGANPHQSDSSPWWTRVSQSGCSLGISVDTEMFPMRGSGVTLLVPKGLSVQKKSCPAQTQFHTGFPVKQGVEDHYTCVPFFLFSLLLHHKLLSPQVKFKQI